MPDKQRTLARRTKTLAGIGLHGGRKAAVMIEPAPAGTGIVFRRAELPGQPLIPARPEFIVKSDRCTVIGRQGLEVRVVEHVIAALVLAGADNAIVNVMSDEVPGMDGSARPFLAAISAEGLVELDRDREPAVLAGPVTLAGEGKAAWSIAAEPAEGLCVTFRFSGPGSLDGVEVSWKPGDETEPVAGARTFCFEREIKALRAAGLGKGGDAGNVLVLGDDGSFLNAARFADEPAWHKLLDLIGDLGLLGRLPSARITASGSGHSANADFIRTLAAKINEPEVPQAHA